MSCSSDSEEFYDAEDITPSHGTRKSRKPSSDSLTHRASSEPNVSTASGSKSSAAEIISTDVPSTNKSHDEILFAEPQKKTTPVGGRRKFRELRQKLQNDDEDCCQTGTVTPPNSQTSSVEGVFATTTGAMTSSATAPAGSSSKASHPFRIIEQDTISLQSINSLGRVARILGGIAEGQGMLPEVGRKAVSVSALSSSSLDSSISSTTTPGSSCKGTAPTTTASSTITTQYPSNATTIPTTLATTTTVVSQQPQQQQPALTNAETTTQYNNNNTGANERNPSEERTTLAPSSAITNSGMVVDHHHHHNQVSLQEPDVIASTKTSANAASAQQQLLLQLGSGGGNNSRQDAAANQSSVTVMTDVPVAPPRRKKKIKCGTDLALRKSASSATFHSESTDLASPASTIESLTREFEHSLDRLPSTKSSRSDRGSESSKSSTLKSGHSLDIKQAIKGQFVVKPQDHASSRGKKDTAATAESSCDRKSSSELLLLSSASLPQQPQTLPEGECVASTSGASTDDKSPRGGSNRSSLGHYSLGPHRGTNQQHHTRTIRERRRSAGDENMLKDSATSLRVVRTHTDSGKQLSDLEILEQVTVLNLDTGERVPLSVAEDKLPQCINPLSLHIMRLTSEYVSSSSMEKVKESDEESVDMRSVKGSNAPATDETDLDVGRLRKKTGKLKRFVGSAMKKAKSIAQEVSHARHKEDIIDIVDNVNPGEQNIKLKASNSHKGPYEFEKVEHVQELKDEHEGPIWCMKFSCCGRLLATAGQDKVLRIWIVRDAFPFFQDMRTKYNAEKVSPTPSQESLVSHHSGDTASSLAVLEALNTDEGNAKLTFMPKPFCTYTGHTSDLLDVSWSKNYFILSSSMDKTVRLWHISRKECLCCFQHIDFVTAIVFHPRDDRYFLSGSLDGKLRLWNIPDKKVAVWNEVEGNPKLITAANFCQNGKFAVVGTYDGRCIFYNTDQLKYHTQIHVRSSRGRNATGRKISGIEPMPGEDKILVTSNDSRIRLYDLRDLNVSCKYKGCVNTSSQIKASFSHDGKFIISGSENRDIYIWKTNHDYAKFTSVRRDRNDFWEAIKAHNAVVTCAIFAPNPEAVIKMIEDEAAKAKSASNATTTVNVSENLTNNNNNNNNSGENRILAGGGATASDKVADPVVEQHTKGCGGYVLVSADFNGCIKVFINKMKPKHSSLPASAMA